MVELSDLLNSPICYRSDVPVLSRNSIEDISNKILSQYLPDALTNQGPIDVERLIEHQFRLHLDIQSFCPDGSILGETVFADGYREVFGVDDSGFITKQRIAVKKGTILLDSSMVTRMPSRTAFTEAHELGHWIMHNRFYGASEKRACRSILKQKLYFPHRETMSPIQWTEWQANTFAASILLPCSALRITLQTFLEETGLTWNKLKDFSSYKNRVKYDEFLHLVAKTYEVSYETARLRMNKLYRIGYPH